jgi:spore maturation protein SpmA
MALSYVWCGFFIVGFLAALAQWVILGDASIFKKIVDGTFESARFAVMDIALPLTGVMTLWMGILAIGEKAGAIDFVARIIAPFFSRIFPGVPRDHPATGLMVMNYSANFLGLDNAATPIGLKAMESLQTLNPKKDEATDAQLMFLVLNTAGMTLIPVSVMAQRAILGAKDPRTSSSRRSSRLSPGTLVALSRRGAQAAHSASPIPWSSAGSSGITGFLLLRHLVFHDVPHEGRDPVRLEPRGNILILSVIVGFIGGALYKRANVYEVFIDGAKGGFQTTVMIIPFLVGMLVAIGVLRNSGVLDMLVGAVAWALGVMGINAEFAPSLPPRS